MDRQPTLIPFIGGPGSGKTTLARGIINSPDYRERSVHISLGDEVRKIRSDLREGHSDSVVASDIERHFRTKDRYDLLPDDIIDQVAIDALRRYRQDDLDLVALDGSPRRISQISDILRLAGATYRIGGVIHTVADRETALLRLLSRSIRLNDDEPETTPAIARHRLALYEENSLGVPLALRHQGITVYDIHTEGPKETTLQSGLGRVGIIRAQQRYIDEPA